jgi:hypothetical protein
MGKMKRNHWVPQSYLRAFSADPDRREKIWRFSKEEGDPELKPIEKVAYRHYLYVPKDASGQRDYSCEVQLSRLEQWFGERPWELLLTGYLDLGDPTVRKMVSLLAAVMFLRNPKALDLANDIHRQMVEFIGCLPQPPAQFVHEGVTYDVDTNSWDRFREGDNEDLKRSWIDSVKQASWLADLFMTMRWAIVISDTPGFITTDHPVTTLHPSLSFRGFNNPETTVVFPLSPFRLLVMDHRMTEPDNQYYPVKDGLACWNYTLWENANEFMFSHRSPDFVLREIAEDVDRTEATKPA